MPVVGSIHLPLDLLYLPYPSPLTVCFFSFTLRCTSYLFGIFRSSHLCCGHSVAPPTCVCGCYSPLELDSSLIHPSCCPSYDLTYQWEVHMPPLDDDDSLQLEYELQLDLEIPSKIEWNHYITCNTQLHRSGASIKV